MSKRRYIMTLLACALLLPVTAQDRQLSRFQYWFDDSQTALTEQALSGATATVEQSIDASMLSEGIHTLYYRIEDSDGYWCPLYATVVFVTSVESRGEKHVGSVEYWLDSDIKSRQTSTIDGDKWNMSIDASMLSEGMHILNYRFIDNFGVSSALHQALFCKQQLKATQVTKLRYWWSNRTDLATDVDVNSPTFSYEALLSVPDYARRDDLTDLGVARFTAVVIDDQGRQSAPFFEDIIYKRLATINAAASEVTGSVGVLLTWNFTDEAGVRDYSIYYAKDDGPFILWKPTTTDTSATFKGKQGIYRFLVVARNMLGQRTSLDDEAAVTVTFK